MQQQLLHLQAGLRLERAARVVHQEELGLHQQAARDTHAPLHSARELGRVVVLEAAWNPPARPGPGGRGGPPSILRLPAVGCSKPATMLSRVDLPQPEGPSSATNSPSPTARSTPVSAVTGLRPA